MHLKDALETKDSPIAPVVTFHPISKSRVLRSIFAITLIQLCIYVAVFHLHSYAIHQWQILIVVIGCSSFSTLTNTWIDDNSLNIWKRLILVVLLLATAALVIIGIGKLQKVLHTNELKKYGQRTSGIVEAVTTGNFDLINGDHALLSYTVNSKKFLQKVGNKSGSYHVGDQLELIVSSRDPEIVKVADNAE